MTPSRFTTVKIAVGYILLLMAVLFSLVFIHREMQKLSDSDNWETLQTDSLFYWLEQKDRNTIRILEELNNTTDNMLSIKDLNEVIAEQDTIIAQHRVQQRVLTKRDSIITPARKKGFFRRLGEVFVPPRKDSAIVVNTSTEVATDTVLEAYNPADSLHRKIRIVTKQLQGRKTIIQRSNSYRELNEELTGRIDSLIKGYQYEALEHVKLNAEQGRSIRQHSTETIGRVAIFAILLSALFLVLIWRDITRSNRYRKELEEEKRLTEELLHAREKLMLAITHDFKAPLGSIMGYSELLSGLVTDERQRFYLENMKTSSEHLLKLVGDLLDFHRLELNKTEVNLLPFHPSQLFEEIRICFEPLAVAKGLALQCHIAPELRQSYLGDPLRIRQVTDNLLSNAIKFTTQGSVSLNVGIERSVLCIEVSDTGKGMEPADLQRIFQEFTRLPGAQGEEGFGLGLSIVSKLVTLLGGKVNVESSPGVGSCFTITLPLQPGKEGEDSLPAIPVPAEPLSSSAPLRILLIDDDVIQLKLTAAMLAQQGIEAVCCEQPDALFYQLRTSTFDVLLTDVQMPALNGFDLLKLLRSSNIPQAHTLPVIAVTARSELSVTHFIRHGFAGCLHKPFTVKELLEVVNGKSDALHFAALTSFSEGDAEASRAIISSFVEETGKNVARMAEAFAVSDTDGIAGMAHKLLPLLTLIGAHATVLQLTWLEGQRGNPFTEEVQHRTAEVLEALRNIIAQAEAYSEKP